MTPYALAVRLDGSSMVGLWVGVGAVLGLAIGSFLNVVAYRVPRGLSLSRPGSFCPQCRVPIAGRDNVPILSWLLLRGRCRNCSVRIPARYPAVEAATGLSFVAVALVVRPLDGVPGYWVLVSTLIALAAAELEGAPCPAYVGLVGGSLGVAALLVGATWTNRGAGLDDTAVGVAIGGVFAAATLQIDRLRRLVGAGGTAAIAAGVGYCWLGPIPSAVGVGVALVVGIIDLGRRDRPSARPARLATCFSVGLLGALLTASLS